jgi:hypothetical protein
MVADLNKVTGSLGDQITSEASTETAGCGCGANYQLAGYAEPGGQLKAIGDHDRTDPIDRMHVR